MAPKTTKFERLVVGAMKRLQDLQGSSAKEISDFLSREYDVPVNEIRKQVRLALNRGVTYGILQRQNGGTYTCNREIIGENNQLRKNRELVEPCPWMKYRGRKKSGDKNKQKEKSSKRRGRRGGRKRRKRKGSKRQKSKGRKRSKSPKTSK